MGMGTDSRQGEQWLTGMVRILVPFHSLSLALFPLSVYLSLLRILFQQKGKDEQADRCVEVEVVVI